MCMGHPYTWRQLKYCQRLHLKMFLRPKSLHLLKSVLFHQLRLRVCFNRSRPFKFALNWDYNKVETESPQSSSIQKV